MESINPIEIHVAPPFILLLKWAELRYSKIGTVPAVLMLKMGHMDN
jgi:hypothetical protein